MIRYMIQYTIHNTICDTRHNIQYKSIWYCIYDTVCNTIYCTIQDIEYDMISYHMSRYNTTHFIVPIVTLVLDSNAAQHMTYDPKTKLPPYEHQLSSEALVHPQRNKPAEVHLKQAEQRNINPTAAAGEFWTWLHKHSLITLITHTVDSPCR